MNKSTEEFIQRWNKFREEWPIERLKTMTLDEYAFGGGNKDSLCQNFERGYASKCGGIGGNTAFKFGIYKVASPSEKPFRGKTKTDGKYAWYTKYGATAGSAFKTIRSRIVQIAKFAAAGTLEEIDKIDFEAMIKWKIAFMYQPDINKPIIAPGFGAKYLKEHFSGVPLEPRSQFYKTILAEIYPDGNFDYDVWLKRVGEDEESQKSAGTPKKSDSTGTQISSKVREIAELLEANHNLILHGAPGTGKTYLAKQIAETMGAGTDEIGFVQFHPSYDYTDFVEGLRPISGGNGEIGFERKDGIFKKFCKKAVENESGDSGNVENFEEAWGKLMEYLTEEETLEVPLISGKRSLILELNADGTSVVERTYENGERTPGEWVRGQSKHFNKDQLFHLYKDDSLTKKWYKNYRKAILRVMKEKFGLKDYVAGTQKVEKIARKNFVFIIDEINRGEVSKIFGELFYSIEQDYRGDQKDENVKTQYQNLVPVGDVFEKGFFVPKNVYIIGTMNDIDLSVESLDFAFRRRFAWREISADERFDEMFEGKTGDWIASAKIRMQNLNAKIGEDEELGKSFQIGPAYFRKLENYLNEKNPFEKLWKFHLEGLLREYLRGRSDAGTKLDTLKKAFNQETESASKSSDPAEDDE